VSQVVEVHVRETRALEDGLELVTDLPRSERLSQRLGEDQVPLIEPSLAESDLFLEPLRAVPAKQ
jgi:hypothetical protein